MHARYFVRSKFYIKLYIKCSRRPKYTVYRPHSFCHFLPFVPRMRWLSVFAVTFFLLATFGSSVEILDCGGVFTNGDSSDLRFCRRLAVMLSVLDNKLNLILNASSITPPDPLLVISASSLTAIGPSWFCLVLSFVVCAALSRVW